MSVMSEWFQEQEQEEREAKRRANLDEWRRIAKMLRDLEYIKVPVRRERDRGGIMICQYCGHKLQSITEDDKGYVPADLTDALAEAAEEVIKSATGAYNEKRTNVSKDKFKKLKDALAAYRVEK